MALVVLVVGVFVAIWPRTLIRVSHFLRPAMPAGPSPTAVRAARAAGFMLVVAAGVLALAMG